MAVGHQLHQWATRARRYSVEFISIAGNLASVAALVIAYLTTTGVRLLEVYLVSLVTTLGLALVIREVQTARRATYAEVLAHLHHVIHHTRDTLHAVGGLPEPDFVRDYVRRVLDDLVV